MTDKEIIDMLSAWENMELVTNEILNNFDLWEDVINFSLNSEHRVSWRAAWLVDKINDKNPILVDIFIPAIIKQVRVEKQHGKRRHFLKVISLHQIPEEEAGRLLDFCLEKFVTEKEPIANRVHAMQILFNISETEPDLKPEILEIIQNELEHQTSPGIRSRGKKLVAQLQKQIRDGF